MKTTQLISTIPPELDEHRLDQALSKLFPQFSRSQLQSWIKAGQVTVDEKIKLRPRDKVSTDQQIELNADPSVLKNKKESWEAQYIPLNIIYEDEALLLINKQAGLVVHPGAGTPDQTLVNALVHYAPELENVPRAGVIHRLDKGTTGLLVVARTLEAHHKLVKALQKREISRQYQAIVNRVMISGGTIEAPIGRHPTQRTKMAVTQAGREAITHYRIIERYRAHTRIQVKLETGRTHQIRVHLSHIHYPIIGDATYGKNVKPPALLSESLKKTLLHFKRPALHAYKLGLIHPITHQSMEWEAPLPDDMKELIRELQGDAKETTD